MAQLTPNQRRWRGRIEAGLHVAAPLLDLVLAAGDRLSRMVDRDDPEPLASLRVGHDGRPRALSDGRD